jgi:hypothetical protein
MFQTHQILSQYEVESSSKTRHANIVNSIVQRQI